MSGGGGGTGRRAVGRWAAAALVAAALPGRAAGASMVLAASGAPGDGFPDGATILVAGPEGGELDSWARRMIPVLQRYLPAATTLRATGAGSADGVTGANQFEVRGAPDGGTILMVPGLAALDWLAGDARAKFDAAKWVPVAAGLSPIVIAGRLQREALGPGHRVRIAASGPIGPELPAVLAVDLLGGESVPVLGLTSRAAARNAFMQGAADLVVLSGGDVPAQVADIAPSGAVPLFSLGTPDETGALVRDPAFPDLPTVQEVYRQTRGGQPSGPLFEAWRATVAAAGLSFGMVLPELTPAAIVSIWRRAVAQAIAAPDLQAAAADSGLRALAVPAATASTAAIAADPAALLALRRWMAAKLNWKPV